MFRSFVVFGGNYDEKKGYAATHTRGFKSRAVAPAPPCPLWTTTAG